MRKCSVIVVIALLASMFSVQACKAEDSFAAKYSNKLVVLAGDEIAGEMVAALPGAVWIPMDDARHKIYVLPQNAWNPSPSDESAISVYGS